MPGPTSSVCDAWVMLKVVLYNHDRSTKTKKGGHSNNAAAGAMILIAPYTQFLNLRVFIIYLLRSYILELFFLYHGLTHT
jgi:hypothetical protein